MTDRTTVTKSISLPPEVAAQLRESAEEEGLPESLIVRWALEQFFTRASRRLGQAAKTAKRKARS